MRRNKPAGPATLEDLFAGGLPAGLTYPAAELAEDSPEVEAEYWRVSRARKDYAEAHGFGRFEMFLHDWAPGGVLGVDPGAILDDRGD